MGEVYCFDVRIIDGREVFGFCYQSEDTGYNEIFVEMTEEQESLAIEWVGKLDKLHQEQADLIKSWANTSH